MSASGTHWTRNHAIRIFSAEKTLEWWTSYLCHNLTFHEQKQRTTGVADLEKSDTSNLKQLGQAHWSADKPSFLATSCQNKARVDYGAHRSTLCPLFGFYSSLWSCKVLQKNKARWNMGSIEALVACGDCGLIFLQVFEAVKSCKVHHSLSTLRLCLTLHCYFACRVAVCCDPLENPPSDLRPGTGRSGAMFSILCGRTCQNYSGILGA